MHILVLLCFSKAMQRYDLFLYLQTFTHIFYSPFLHFSFRVLIIKSLMIKKMFVIYTEISRRNNYPSLFRSKLKYFLHADSLFVCIS